MFMPLPPRTLALLLFCLPRTAEFSQIRIICNIKKDNRTKNIL
jgi:hypothetical protein